MELFADTTPGLGDLITSGLDLWMESTEQATVPEAVNSTLAATTTTTTVSTTTTTTQKPCTVWTYPPCDALVQAAYDLGVYGVYVSYVLGIPGSILTLIILTRMRPFNSSSAWLFCLSCTDLCGLTLRMIVSIYLAKWRWVNWWCRFYYIMARATKHVSFFCLVGLTVERFIAVWFPLKMNVWCTIRRAVICFFSIIVIIISADLHQIYTRRVSGNGQCITRLKYRYFWQNTYEKYILLTLYQTVPMLTLIILNILIAVRLRSSRKVQKEMTDQKTKEKDRQQKQIDRMLLAATIMFCVFVLPQIIFSYTEFAWAGGDMLKSFLRARARHIVVMMCNTFNVFNHAVNFILYVLVAQKFRSEIIRLITCGRYTSFGRQAK